jgi:single-strand DNA-binding protein
MAEGVNSVILLGNLGTEPELRETRAGKSVCNFKMATNSSHGRGENRRDRTEWHAIVSWGRLAEMCAECLSKGSSIFVMGHLQTKEWTDRDGNDRKTTEIIAEKISFLDKRTGERENFDVECE